jgi:cyclase
MRGPKTILALLAIGVIAALSPTYAQEAPAGKVVGGHRFVEIAPGVYAAYASGTIQTQSNSCVIVNRDDVLIVDTHVTPAAARALVQDIKALSDKPIKYVVNTHFHFDHTDGNQVFGPDVQIIGHLNSARMIQADMFHRRVSADQQAAMPGNLDTLRNRVAAEADPTAKARLQQQLNVAQANFEALKEVRATPPNVTFADRKTIMSGDREIQLIHFDRAHTNSDVVVFLPKEKVVCTGDFFEGPVTGFLGDAYVNDYPAALEKLKALDFVEVVPGHGGDTFKGKERIDYFQAYLRDLWQQGKRLHDEKVSAADAAKRIDLTAHRTHYAAINGPGVATAAVTRIYELLDGKDGLQ